MPKKPETHLQKRIRKAIEKEWPLCWGFKVHGSMFQETGIPDLIFCIEGYLIAPEVKTPQDRRRKEGSLQEFNIKLINRAGGYGFFTASPEAAVRKIKKFLDRKATEHYEQAVDMLHGHG